MVKKNQNKKRAYIPVIITSMILVALIVAGIYTNPAGLTLYGESVWIPQYLSGTCVERSNSFQGRTIDHTDDPTWYHCTTNEAGTYIPDTEECEYTISGFNTYDAIMCSGYTEDKEDADCDDKTLGIEVFSYTSKTFFVAEGDSLYLNTGRLGGDTALVAKYPSYGLRVETADGRDWETTTNCYLSSLSGDVHIIDENVELEVHPEVPFNAVTGLSLAKSTQSVVLSGVNAGRPIYITKPGYYYQITEAEDGFSYVDTTREYASARIECIPRTTGCSDDAKVVELEDQSCDQFGGAIADYSPVQGDQTQLCKYACTDGKLSVTNDCIQIVNDCPDDKPLWNARTGQCVALEEELPDDNEEFDPFFIYLGMGVIFALLIILVIRMSLDKRR